MVRESTHLPNKTVDARDQLTLVSEFEPAGDQVAAIAGLCEGLNDGLARQTLLGVTGSGKTFTVASVIAELQRPAIILAPNKTLAAQLYGEMREFFLHAMPSSTLSRITITTSPKPMCRVRIRSSRRTHRSISTSSRCACRPPKR